MADLRSSLKTLADHLPVPELPSQEEIVGRSRRRRQRQRLSLTAGVVAVALVAGLLVSLLPATAPHRKVASSPPDIALAAGRQAFATHAGPPIGAMGTIGANGLWVLDGDGLFISNDNGLTWMKTTPPSAGDPLADLLSVDFTDLQRGWVVASREQSVQVDRTVDSGSTWQVASLPTSLFPNGWNGADVAFMDAQDGWLTIQPYVSPGKPATSVLFASTDGGITWNVVDPNAPVSEVNFETTQLGWGISPDGTTLFRTKDGGSSWTQVNLPPPAPIANTPGTWQTFTVPVFVGNDGAMLAAPASGNAVVEVTSDAGQTWSEYESPFEAEAVYPSPAAQPSCARCVGPTEEPFAVIGPNRFVYWAGGQLFTTTDGGRSWISTQPNLSFSSIESSITSIGGQPVVASADPLQFSSPTTGWAVATVNGQSILLMTQDRGAHFVAVSPPISSLP